MIPKPFNPRAAQQGFTLLEVVIATVIAALIGIMAFGALDGASRGAERTNTVLDEINRLDRTWQIIANDLRHVLPPDGRNTIFQAQTLQTPGEHAEQLLMLFKRRAWVNFSNQPRSDLQMVGYRLDEGILWRDFLPEFNRDVSQIDMEREAFHQRLLENVEDVQLRFLHQNLLSLNGKSVLEGQGYSDNWLQQWPDPAQAGATGLPIAVEITLKIKGVGASVRLFVFPEQ
ncbi:type II secretion system minor pseudopilin GspJ [Cellvibrio japonicus]|uniref:Type II secretion system protein J n=1 Tax=Cellvibrio japonicus (strain Ueda107) TaxID=498211 RepID=B3PF12_CELJU|nr:type II secretion system minor pseudopilin GspJ [Cellvibrio japonicus]ACE85344.1 General secretion pathway protein J [Cellvibrio japonicus Ueda107]QEI13574.1 type II secretion system protein GspJ [Cellvibrio japonicus]QEI17148.1 type II secretion system protein GspJ [Cellvibrio japonicus]QEI20725.1 type II secretion system protein GspJ [Cellvibrio japonicus]